MPRFVYDLHCDLSTYLAWSPQNSFCDPALPCNLQALDHGNVAVQICAIFTGNEAEAWRFAERQLAALHQAQQLAAKHQIELRWAIENAACWFEAGVEVGLQRIAAAESKLGHCSYVGLTWNGANALAGGCGSDSDLSAYGREVTLALVNRGVPLDFSHLNDRSAAQLIKQLDRIAPQHPVLASHANARTVLAHARNLPDWLIQELIVRQGIVGICWYKPFVGPTASWFWRHVEHILELGGVASLALGTDFMGSVPYPPDRAAPATAEPYFSEYATASDVAAWQTSLEQHFGTSITSQLLHDNPRQWLAQCL